MKIINNKKEAVKELKRISTRTSSGNNNKINEIVEEILFNSSLASFLLFMIFICLIFSNRKAQNQI